VCICRIIKCLISLMHGCNYEENGVGCRLEKRAVAATVWTLSFLSNIIFRKQTIRTITGFAIRKKRNELQYILCRPYSEQLIHAHKLASHQLHVAMNRRRLVCFFVYNLWTSSTERPCILRNI